MDVFRGQRDPLCLRRPAKGLCRPYSGRIAAMKAVGFEENNAAAVAIDIDADLDEIVQSLAQSGAPLRRHKKQEEAAAAGAQQFAADGARRPPGRINLVDRVIRDDWREIPLQLPTFVQELADLGYRTAVVGKDVDSVSDHVVHARQLRLPVPEILDLLLCYICGKALKPGEVKDKVVEEIARPLFRNDNGRHPEPLPIEFDVIEPAIRHDLNVIGPGDDLAAAECLRRPRVWGDRARSASGRDARN